MPATRPSSSSGFCAGHPLPTFQGPRAGGPGQSLESWGDGEHPSGQDRKLKTFLKTSLYAPDVSLLGTEAAGPWAEGSQDLSIALLCSQGLAAPNM